MPDTRTHLEVIQSALHAGLGYNRARRDPTGMGPVGYLDRTHAFEDAVHALEQHAVEHDAALAALSPESGLVAAGEVLLRDLARKNCWSMACEHVRGTAPDLCCLPCRARLWRDRADALREGKS